MLSCPPNGPRFFFFKTPTAGTTVLVPEPVAHPHGSMPDTPLSPPSTPVHAAPLPYSPFPFGYGPYPPPYTLYPPFAGPYPPNPHAPAMAGPLTSPAWTNLQESSCNPSDPEVPNPYPETMAFMETLATSHLKCSLDCHVKVFKDTGYFHIDMLKALQVQDLTSEPYGFLPRMAQFGLSLVLPQFQAGSFFKINHCWVNQNAKNM